MVQHKPTPEEQLLKLIENPSAAKQTGASDGGKKISQKTASFRFPDINKWISSLAYFKADFRKQSGGVRDPFKLDLKFANRVLVVLSIAFGIYLVFDVLSLKSGHADFLNQVGTNDPVFPPAFDPAKASTRELTYYQDPLSQRNPFLPPGTVPVQSPEKSVEGTASSQPSAPIQEILQGVKLVGISWGEEPLAMIEDVQTNRTYFFEARSGA